MHGGDALLLILIMIFGCAAFFFGVIYLLGKFIAWIGRGMFGILKPSASNCSCEDSRIGSQGCACPRKLCGRIEYRPEARYCSQCGAQLTHSPRSGPL